jgi:hypothetical protein
MIDCGLQILDRRFWPPIFGRRSNNQQSQIKKSAIRPAEQI